MKYLIACLLLLTVTPAKPQEAEAVYQASWAHHYQLAVAKWPEMADPTSALHLLAASLQTSALETPTHPFHARAMTGESGYLFAEQAATLLGKVQAPDEVSALQREVLELRKALAQVTTERDAALQNAQQNYLAATQAQARVQAGNLQALQALTAPSNRAAEQAQAKEESFRRAREANAELQRSNLEYELQRLNRQLQR
jgi:hypothetical protein